MGETALREWSMDQLVVKRFLARVKEAEKEDVGIVELVKGQCCCRQRNVAIVSGPEYKKGCRGGYR